jgi:hypothetical protein
MYRLLYGLTTPILTVARRFWPQYISTEELGRAMLVAVKRGTQKRVVEAKQIGELLQALSKVRPAFAAGQSQSRIREVSC